MRLTLLPSSLAVCRLDPNEDLPPWATGAFVSMTRTSEELSIVCDAAAVPEGVRVERDWRAFKLEGPIPFETTGVAAALLAPLAAAKISIFLISTFDTDYLLVKSASLAGASNVLRDAGYVVG